jgi:UDP-N-acetylmuramate dehydrogenase
LSGTGRHPETILDDLKEGDLLILLGAGDVWRQGQGVGAAWMRVLQTVQAHDVTSMHCGGTIERIFEPEDIHQLMEIIRSHKDFHVLGGGTNTIFEDAAITRPVIRLGREFSGIEHIPGGILAGAAVSMKHLVSYCVNKGLTGIEFMAGIPGLLGGAIFMNAGTPEKGILDAVTEIEFVDGSGTLRTIRPRELDFTYRKSNMEARCVIVSAKIALRASTKENVRAIVLPYLHKKRSQPRGYNSGSIFKNPKDLHAGWLLDQAGLKGYRIGGAKVSELHANFIINDGTATTGDIKELISVLKKEVNRLHGIELVEEVRIIGQ